jgi:hypothetical protein|nr:MAG: hypothetical protein [Bacteriophage sp.]DAZ56206.1 MAG TPA: zinc-ribbon domain protein [Caudoviricetes sp.]
MARRKTTGISASTQYHCRDCANSYDWHSLSLKGEPILCRCPHKAEGGKWCIFLSDPACDEHFSLRQ